MNSPTAKVIEQFKVFGNENGQTGFRRFWAGLVDKYSSDAKWAGAEPIQGTPRQPRPPKQSKRQRKKQSKELVESYLDLLNL